MDLEYSPASINSYENSCNTTGYLEKQSNIIKKFHKRYLIINNINRWFYIEGGNQLNYKKDEQSEKLKGSILLSQLSLNIIDDLTFQLAEKDNGKKFTFRAENKNNCDMWVINLTNILKQLQDK